MFKILSRPQINLEDMMKLEKWKSMLMIIILIKKF
jgi:hypothetical protein